MIFTVFQTYKYFILVLFLTLVFTKSFSQCSISNPSASDGCVFQVGQTTLSASGSTGFYQWYDDASGDSLIGTGATYQTPVLNTSKTFYVAATDTNTGLSFDGVNDYIALNTSYSSAGEIPTLTVEAWVNTTVSSGNNESNWAILDFDRSEYFNFYILGSSGRVGFSTNGPNSGTDDFYSTGESVNDGNWHHIVAVYDGVDKIIYIDGIEVARKTNPHGGEALGSGLTRFGMIGDGSEAPIFNGNRNNRYYEGLVDEIRLWSDVRTPTEIINFKDTTLSGAESGLEMYFNFNEVSGNTITDLSHNGISGTLYNMNSSSSWVDGAGLKQICKSNIIPVEAIQEVFITDTLLTRTAPQITLDAGTGFSANTTYLWSTGETTQSITTNESGFYEVTTSNGLCNGSARIAVDGFTDAEKSLTFDGVDDYVAIDNIFYEGTDYTALSVQAWIKTTNGGDQIIAAFDRSDYWRVGINGAGGAGELTFDIRTNSGILSISSNVRIDDGQWHHVTCVFNQGAGEVFIDGILNNSASLGSTFGSGNTRYGILGVGSEATSFNGNTGPNNFFSGEIDEFRIWNKALTQAEIRANMAQHISGNTPDLQVYYKFDNVSNDTVFDHNTKFLCNGLLRNASGTTQVTSSAPVGDNSITTFNSTWAGISSSIHSFDDEVFTLSDITGNPEGIILYYVNNIPNSFSGLSGTGVYNRYFGVHKIGDPLATYQATYNYDGNPFIDITNEHSIELFKRSYNNTPMWTNTSAVLDTAANNIIASGQLSEYIIDYNMSFLPVELISFTGQYNAQDNLTELLWSTGSERNCDYYLLESSSNGIDFELLEKVEGAGNSSTTLYYKEIDAAPKFGINYYRLTQVDFDGTYKDLGIVSVVRRSEKDLVVYPNPSSRHSSIQLISNLAKDQEVNIELYTSHGERLDQKAVLLKSGTHNTKFALEKVKSPGVYTLHISGEQLNQTKKLIVY